MNRQQETLGRPPVELLLAAHAAYQSATHLVVSDSEKARPGTDVVDEQSDQSFPASDPHSFSGLSL